MPNKKHYNGFSLIEVLIALCLTAIILTEITETQLHSMQINQQAFYVGQATEQLEAMADIIQITQGDYAAFLSLWNQNNKILLPHGRGEVKNYGEQYKIYLFWHIGQSPLQQLELDAAI